MRADVGYEAPARCAVHGCVFPAWFLTARPSDGEASDEPRRPVGEHSWHPPHPQEVHAGRRVQGAGVPPQPQLSNNPQGPVSQEHPAEFRHGSKDQWPGEFSHSRPSTWPASQDPLAFTIGRSEVERRGDYIDQLHQQLGERHPMVQLVEQCLDNDPEYRASSEDVLQRLEGMRRQIRDPYIPVSHKGEGDETTGAKGQGDSGTTAARTGKCPATSGSLKQCH